ncbi:MAG: rhomboid family intramembrane serine protease [Nitriliruptoraceae bacterium]|nr:rhomboid family intramembrane serine protease [Nitriliruptoraceae bacterium]
MVLPIGDINPTRRRSVVMWSLLLTNLAAFLGPNLLLEGCEQLAFVYRFAVIPAELTGGGPLPASELGGLLGDCAVPDKSVWLSAITTMFLHGSLAHLLGNLIFLGVFGDNVEDRLGHGRFLVFYLVGGLAGTATYVALQPSSTVPLVGASGAISAVLGAYLICFPRARVLTLVPFPLYLVALVLPGVRIRTWLIIVAIVTLPAWLLLGGWLALQAMALTDELGDMVAYEAHVAGFVAGILLLLLLDSRRSRRGQEPFHPTSTSRGRRR